MQSVYSSLENKRYNDESLFLDELYEFHPDFFESLSAEERALLDHYYLLGASDGDIPENVFEYRAMITKDNPDLANKAKMLFDELLQRAGIPEFTYTTKILLGKTANNRVVYLDLKNSHAPLHIEEEPKLLDYVKEVLPRLNATTDNVYVDFDLGRPIGKTALVQTLSTDKRYYAKRKDRDDYLPFVKNRLPETTSYVTIVLHEQPDEGYNLWSAWTGRVTPSAPMSPYASSDSETFWRSHALVEGSQPIRHNTIRTDWPW